MVVITDVLPRSRAAKAGILANDILLSINGNAVSDVLDYRFYLTEKKVDVTVKRGEETLVFTMRKGEYDDIGLCFATPLMDQKHTCRNKCIFCFIDQLPKGLRETLYFKDDDSRLSFLHGNYITLTNMSDADIDRIVKMRFSPINISVHTTNPELRERMMHNRRAGEVLGYLDRIADAGLTLRCQIVLCRGINDGEELDRTMRDLVKYHPHLDSVSVVPAGLTKHREGLYPLLPYSPEECSAIIKQVEDFAAECLAKCGSRLFHAADELYIKAGLPLPPEEAYEDYPQIENGVGLTRSLQEEFEKALSLRKEDEAPVGERRITLATGKAAAAQMQSLAEKLHRTYPNVLCTVVPIENDFFGPEITVAGLLTGRDLLAQLKDRDLGQGLLIPRTCLRNEGDLFLCGMSLQELSDALQVPVMPTENDGYTLLSAMLGE